MRRNRYYLTPAEVLLLRQPAHACPVVHRIADSPRLSIDAADVAEMLAEKDKQIRKLYGERAEFMSEILELTNGKQAAEFEAERWLVNWAVAVGALFAVSALWLVALWWRA